MCRYLNAKLIRYEDAIRLHFDKNHRIAWLTLRNYGFVFHRLPWVVIFDAVYEVTIGIPVQGFTKDELDRFKLDRGLRPLYKLVDWEHSESFSISACLDVPEVIKFQQRAIELAGSHSQGGKAYGAAAPRREFWLRGAMFDLLHAVFVDIGFKRPRFAIHTDEPTNPALDLRIRLNSTFCQSPGAPWIEEHIRKYREHQTGLIAWFPMPSLIIEEQQTATKGNGNGKTKNQDMRDIRPVFLPGVDRSSDKRVRTSPKGKGHFGEVFGEELIKLIDDDLKNPESGFQKSTYREGFFQNSQKFPNAEAYLHQQIDKIDCYAFRGDSRDPIELKGHNGFLPGITRTDAGVAAYQSSAILLNLAVKPRLKGTIKSQLEIMEEMKKVGWEDSYEALLAAPIHSKPFRELLKLDLLELLKFLDVLTLNIYTVDHGFKGYISTSTSTAIAKALAGIYAPVFDTSLLNFCYALRCKNGFYLPTHVDHKSFPPDVEFTGWQKSYAKTPFTEYAEQEVAVAGCIMWQDVCGVRPIRIDHQGQHFCGPVFMIETLHSSYKPSTSVSSLIPRTANNHNGPPLPEYKPESDDSGYGELFELLSGKSQGAGFEIEFTYPDAPFDIPDWLIAERNKHQ